MKNENVIRISYMCRPILMDVFHNMLDRKSRERTRKYYGNMYDLGYDWGDYYDDGDDDDYAFGGSNALSRDEYYAVRGNLEGWKEYAKSHSKKGKGKKKKKDGGKLSSFVKKDKSLVEDDTSVDLLDFHTIYFYADYQNKYSRDTFSTLKEFDDFCKEQGFKVPMLVSEDLCYNKVSHVCVNPLSFANGKLEIMCDESYADLYYDALCMEESYADM